MLRDTWQKSSRCGSNACVEVRAAGPDRVEVRNSTDPQGPVVAFTANEWTAFLSAARNAEFDI